MSATTSITLTPPRRLSRRPHESIKRIKLTTTITTPRRPTSESPLDLPVELMAKALVFLAPDIVSPGFCSGNCGLTKLAQVSKRCRALALDEDVWKCICKLRWKTKVDYATRMAKAEAEAERESCIAGINGKYWYSKFVSEERDAARTTITPSELYDTTFSVRLWFRAHSYPPEIQKVKGVYPSGLDGHSLSDNVIFLADGTVTGLPRKYDDHAFFEMDEEGSIVNLGMAINLGTHRSCTLYIFRRPDWGWELRSQAHVMRSLSHDNIGDEDGIDKLWSDYASKLVVELRRKGVTCTRGKKKYTRREVPDVPELMKFLSW